MPDSNVYVQKPNPNPKKGFKIWSIISGFALIVGVLANWEPIMKLIRSPKQNFENEKLKKGTLYPPKIKRNYPPSIVDAYEQKFVDTSIARYPKIIGIKLDSLGPKDYITFHLGNFQEIYDVDSVYKGVDLFKSRMGPFDAISPIKLFFGIKNFRLYVKTEFKDLEHEETIGIIQFNHWKLYRDNMLTSNNDDLRLEVYDKSNRVVFGIRYEGGHDVYLTGYFIDEDAVYILKNTSFNPLKFVVIPKNQGYLGYAKRNIDSITRIFPED